MSNWARLPLDFQQSGDWDTSEGQRAPRGRNFKGKDRRYKLSPVKESDWRKHLRCRDCAKMPFRDWTVQFSVAQSKYFFVVAPQCSTLLVRGCRMKWSRPDRKYYPTIDVEGLRNTTRHVSQCSRNLSKTIYFYVANKHNHLCLGNRFTHSVASIVGNSASRSQWVTPLLRIIASGVHAPLSESALRIPYGCILGFLDRSRYFFFQVAPQLYLRGWVDLVPDPLLLTKSGSAGNRTRTSGSVAWNSDH
jgi:hypothetical protein